MASNSGTGSRPRRKRNLKYFYLGQNLYKVLRVNRALDFVEVWNYTETKREGFVWSDLRRRWKRGWTMAEVCSMMGRNRVNIETHILAGNIKAPQRIYTLDGEKRPGKYIFSEEDVLALHDYLLTVHIGRPRKDGRITPGRMPSRVELRAMMKHELVTYVKTDEGKFVPIWQEEDW